ncbi:MAG: secretion protein HlyD [Pirellulaceae bacterium]|nr:MAG: secretion protein HlyD [Pirellulaceae bacterium]
MIQRLILLVAIAAGLLGLLLISRRTGQAQRVSGFIEVHEIRLGSRVGGRVAKVHVEEGQTVTAGAVLVELEPFDLEQRLQEAEALVAQRQAEYDRLRAGFRAEEIAQARARREQLLAELEKLRAGPRPQEIAAAEAEWKLALAELELADQKLKRTRALLAQNSATQEALDEALAQWRVAQARVTARQEQLDLLREGTRREDLRRAEAQLEEAEQAWKLLEHGYRSEEIAEAQAALAAARAARDAIRRQIEELRIVAPIDGTVEAIQLRPGDLVPANATALTLLDTSQMWIRAYIPENRLYIQTGQQLWISVDSYPNERFRGEVIFVARQAEFTPGNVQTPEERSQQVYRIKVLIREGKEKLRPGMAADVWLPEPG